MVQLSDAEDRLAHVHHGEVDIEHDTVAGGEPDILMGVAPQRLATGCDRARLPSIVPECDLRSKVWRAD
eukprot:15324921-Heterocapsa_arctica.AAC.1